MNLSVLVPVYQVEPYIERCVRSLMEQTLVDGIEYIFIDDASPDRSIEILEKVIEEYPERKDQIRLIRHKQNQGVASTRTQAIREAKGKYLGWCDADDWCEPTMFESLLNVALSNESDIVTCGYYIHHSDDTMTVCNRKYDTNPRSHIQHIYKQPDTTLFLWNMILRLDIFIQHQILPIAGIEIGEDMNMLVRFFIHSERLSSIPAALYHHCENNSSSLTRRHCKSSRFRFEQDIRDTESICDFLASVSRADFHLACQYYRFMTKWGYGQLLGFSREYFDLYRETHRDIHRFTGIPYLLRFKMSVFFCCYPVYLFCSLLIRLFYRP